MWVAERPRALVAITHRLGEHSGRYAALAGVLAQNRFTVAALDLPGNGEAPGPRGDTSSWSRLRDVVVPSMFTLPRGMPGQPPELPVVLFGHSMGGLLALDFALSHPRSLLGVVACAPAVRTAQPPAVKLAMAWVASKIAPAAGFPNGLDEDAISRDREVVALRESDPLVHDRISPRMYFAMLEAQKRVMNGARGLAVPALLLQATADRWVDPRGTLEFNAAAPDNMVRLFTYRDAYHEVFNDLARDLAIRDLLDWLDAIVVG